MVKLIDELRGERVALGMPFLVEEREQERWDRMAKGAIAMLRDPELPVLLIDNVAEYFYAGTDQEQWSLDRDFPNLAPPFPQWWCEHRMVKTISSKECGNTDMSRLLPQGGRVGVLFTVLEPASIGMVQLGEEVKWALWAELFIDFAGIGNVTATGPHGSMLLAIDKEGRITQAPMIQNLGGKEAERVLQSLVSWLHPALLAVSFLHCKNVTVVENPVPPKLAKRYRERHGGERIAPFKTLVIEPLKQILRTQGRSGEVGVAKAMHICRGHFRDYRQGAGLFGKYHQLVWTPAVVRGTKGHAAPREIEVKL